MDTVQIISKMCCFIPLLDDRFLCARLKGDFQSCRGEFMKPNILTEDRDNLTVKEKIELLKALNHAEQLDDDEIDELSLPEYYFD